MKVEAPAPSTVRPARHVGHKPWFCPICNKPISTSYAATEDHIATCELTCPPLALHPTS